MMLQEHWELTNVLLDPKESINVLIKQFNHLTSERAVVESWNQKSKETPEIKLEPIYIKIQIQMITVI